MTDATADRVVDSLVAEGLLRDEDRARARDVVAARLEAPAPSTAGAVPKLVEVVAYLGAALVLAAGALFIAQSWNDLSKWGQVAAMLVVALVLGVAGTVARGGFGTVEESAVRRRLAGTLYAGAAVAFGFTASLSFDALNDQASYDVFWPAVVGGVVATVVATIGYRLAPTAAGLLAMLGGALVAAPTASSGFDNDEALWVGGAFFVVGALWLVLTECRVFGELTIARSLGVSTAFFGAQFIALASDRHALGYILTAGLVVASVLLYLAQLAWPYLTAAVIGITFVVPEAVSDWTDGNLDVISGVLLTGVTLLAASFAGYKLRAEAVE